MAICTSLEEFDGLATSWNALCRPDDGPFVTHQWLRAWWSAFAASRPAALLVRAQDGRLQAGAVLARDGTRRRCSATNVYSDAWDVVAEDDRARAQVWRAIAGLDASQLRLSGIPTRGPSAAVAERELRGHGWRVAVTPDLASPRLDLPPDWPSLMAGVSRKLRFQVGRARRQLEREGRLVLRTQRGPGHERDLLRLLSLEASGWKGTKGTAILQDRRALQLFTDFAASCAAAGWLRLQLLELDGQLIAGDCTCVVGDGAFLLKTTYDERQAHLSPGLVLRAEALRAAVDEGLRRYDFLGGPDPYKLRWASDVQPHVVVRAYRGAAGLPAYVWRHEVRKTARVLAAAYHDRRHRLPPSERRGSRAAVDRPVSRPSRRHTT